MRRMIAEGLSRWQTDCVHVMMAVTLWTELFEYLELLLIVRLLAVSCWTSLYSLSLTKLLVQRTAAACLQRHYAQRSGLHAGSRHCSDSCLGLQWSYTDWKSPAYTPQTRLCLLAMT